MRWDGMESGWVGWRWDVVTPFTAFGTERFQRFTFNSVIAAPCSLHTAHCSLPSAHYSLAAHCSLNTFHCSPLIAHCSLLTAHHSLLLLTAHCSLLTAHSLPLTTHCSLLMNHCSLLTAHCSLLTALSVHKLRDRWYPSCRPHGSRRHRAPDSSAHAYLLGRGDVRTGAAVCAVGCGAGRGVLWG